MNDTSTPNLDWITTKTVLGTRRDLALTEGDLAQLVRMASDADTLAAMRRDRIRPEAMVGAVIGYAMGLVTAFLAGVVQ